MFEEELNSWYSEPTMWPKDLSFKMFPEVLLNPGFVDGFRPGQGNDYQGRRGLSHDEGKEGRPIRKIVRQHEEMSERLFRNPEATHSSEAAHIALFFANVAWNECVGMSQTREGYRSAWETIEAENPELLERIEIERQQRHDR